MLQKSSQYIRPYKIEIYGLQDNFIGTLQSYNDISIGRLNEPILEISTDGTQSFTGSIPKYYIDKTNNQRKLNPRWADTENGVLAENTRILKVFIKHDNDIRVFPLIIDSITTKRDKNFSVYREITASGLAFAELGKLGYKLELTSHTLETDYEEDSSTVATINYWLDKVFPNEKDADGKIIKWLTPWCYEIRMDWETVTGENLVSDKIYDTPHINSWGLTSDGKALTPLGITGYQEKARYIDCKDSNKYNITQTLAETFEVFCTYEYKCAENGTFIRNYMDEKGNYWTGRKVVFYNRAINMDNPLTVNYQKNLDSVSRTVDSSEIYTKMYVRPIESTVMSAGQIDISNTPLNPLQEDFILDFDYLYSIGGITQEQNDFIEFYKAQLHAINTNLTQKYDQQIVYENELEKLEADIAFYNKAITSAQDNLTTYQPLRDNEQTGTVTVGGEDGTTPVNIYFAENSTLQRYEGTLRHTGIDVSTILGYTSQTDAKKDGTDEESEDSPINPAFNNVLVYNNEKLSENIDKFFFLSSDNGAQNKLITSLNNPLISGESGVKSFWLTYTYNPRDYYEDICNMYTNILNQYNTKKSNAETAKTTKEATLSVLKIEIKILETEKTELNKALENRLGPALREGYWAPDSYEDPGQSCKENVSINHAGVDVEQAVSMYFDTEPLENEEKGWYTEDVEGIPTDSKTFYPYCLIPKATYQAWAQNLNNILDLTIHLQQKVTTEVNQENFKFAANTSKYYQVMFNGEYRYFIISNNTNTEVTYKSMTLEENGTNLNLTFTSTANKKLSIVWKTKTDIGSNPTTLLTLPFSNSVYLYNNAGFIFGFVQTSSNSSDKVFKPALIFNDRTINESFSSLNLAHLAYSFANVTGVTVLANKTSLDTPKLSEVNCLGYPRIRINQDNVMYESDTLKITPFTSSTAGELVYSEGVYSSLTEFDEYMTTVDNGQPVFTLKLSKDQSFDKILHWPYHVDYKISRANEMLYRDALIVAHDSSRPKYSYELTVANLPENINNVQLGQLVLINDFSVGIRSETGYISSIKFDLDNPQNDDITIQDYTTKFEDLFTTITATNEAMKQNQSLYNTIATNFTSGGQISGNVLQSVFNNNNIAFNYSATQVEVSPTEGIILTNLTPYDNGVYGQVVLKGGGVFLSSSIDAEGNRIWSNAITPMGINASSIATGVLDTSRIRVYAGDDLAFQWNADGIFAYKKSDTGTLLTDAYVKYSNEGLQFILEEAGNVNNCSVHLGWEGLKLSAQSGALTLTAQDGLQIFYPETNGVSQAALQVGRWSKKNVGAGANTINYYGMRLFDTSGNETFTVDNYGNLMITGTMQSGRFASGILGYGWRICNDGTAEFKDVHVRGTISASVFEYKETTAVGGELYVGPTLIVDYNRAKNASIYINSANTRLVLDVDLGFTGSGDNLNTNLCGRKWAKNDVVSINCCLTATNNDIEYKYEIKNFYMYIYNIHTEEGRRDSLLSSGSVWDTSVNIFYDENGNPITVEEVLDNIGSWNNLKPSGPINCIFIGSQDGDTGHNRKGVLITAMADESPYIDIYDDAAVHNELKGAPKVRIGNLAGLGELSWDGNIMKPEGYGLYSDNVYLTGAIYATSGKIGSLSIDELENKQLKIDIQLGDKAGFIINTSVPTYRPTIYPKLYIDNQLITGSYPDSLNSLKYFYQYSIDGQTWTNFAIGVQDWGNSAKDREYTFSNNSNDYLSTILARYYRVGIELRYTNNNQEETLYSAPYQYSAIENGPEGYGHDDSQLFYLATKENDQPEAEDINKTSIAESGYNEETPYLWQKTITTYKNGTNDTRTETTIVLIGVWGSTGDPGRNYYLTADTHTISRDIGGAVVPNSVTVTCAYTDGADREGAVDTGITSKNYITVNLVTYSYTADGVVTPTVTNITSNTNITVSKGVITIKSLSNIIKNYNNISSISIILYSSTNKVFALASTSIDFTLGEKLRELGKLQQGEVIIADGKVYANAIVAGQITAGKIAAGALTAGCLSNVGTLRLFSTDSTIKYPDAYDDKYWNSDDTFKALEYDNAIAAATEEAWKASSSGIEIGNDGILMKGRGIELNGSTSIVLKSGNSAVTIKPNYFNIKANTNRFYIENSALHILNITTTDVSGAGLKLDKGSLYITSASYDTETSNWKYDTINPYVTISQDGLEAASASFKTLSVNGRDIQSLLNLGVEHIAVSTTQPSTKDTLWFKPSSISKLEYTWYTGDGRGENNGLWGSNDGKSITLSPVTQSVDSYFPNNQRYNYTLSFEIVKIVGGGQAAKNVSFSFTLHGYDENGTPTQLEIPSSGFYVLPEKAGNWSGTIASSADVAAHMTVKNSQVNLCGKGMQAITATWHIGVAGSNVYINKEQNLRLTCTTTDTSGSVKACSVYYIP